MKNALITGGTGYVGAHLVDALAARSVAMTVLARPATPQAAKEFVRSRGATVREVDFDAPEGFEDAFAGCEVWFHLIGSIARLRADPFERRHRELTARLGRTARRAGAPRVVFLTALGASVDACNAYHRTKWEAEREIDRQGIPGAIVRPSLICGRVVGPRNSKLVERYIRMIRGRQRAVVLGDGRNRIQPIDVRDLVECMIRAGERDNADLVVHELGGPEQLEFGEFVRRLAEALGVGVRVRHLPLWLAAVAARFLERIQAAPTLTREQVALMREDNACALDSVETQFGFRPRTLRESLESYGEDQR